MLIGRSLDTMPLSRPFRTNICTLLIICLKFAHFEPTPVKFFDCSSEELTIWLLKFGQKGVNDIGIKFRHSLDIGRSLDTVLLSRPFGTNNFTLLIIYLKFAGFVPAPVQFINCSSEELTISLLKFGQKVGNGICIKANRP